MGEIGVRIAARASKLSWGSSPWRRDGYRGHPVKDRASATRHGDFALRRKTTGSHPDLRYVNPLVSLITM
jgi:hypothetical protein